MHGKLNVEAVVNLMYPRDANTQTKNMDKVQHRHTTNDIMASLLGMVYMVNERSKTIRIRVVSDQDSSNSLAGFGSVENIFLNFYAFFETSIVNVEETKNRYGLMTQWMSKDSINFVQFGNWKRLTPSFYYNENIEE
eukprot:c34461_g1_i1 orf=992-1402(+)